MPLPVTDQATIRSQMRGFCRVVCNISDFSRPAIEETITGVSTNNGRFIGGLSEEPSFASSDEVISYTENLYGSFGEFKGGWAIQSQTYTLTLSMLKLTPENFQLLFPDYEDLGAWQGPSPDGGTTPGEVYGQIITRSGNVTDASYIDNVCLCFEGQNKDSIGMVMRLNNVTNRADDKEFSPDGDGNISGVEAELMAHESFDQLTGGERVPPFSIYLPDYMAETAPA